MKDVARRAFASARTRAMRSRLLGPEDRDRLRGAPSAASLAAALRALGLPPDGPEQTEAALRRRLFADAAALARSWPVGRGLLLALARLDEVENLKLGLGARALSLPPAAWVPRWRDLGELAALPLACLRDSASLREAAQSLARTPYAAIAEEVLRVHGSADGQIGLAVDRWASRRLLDEAARLPPDDADATELVRMLVRERDLDALLRVVAAFGVPPDQAAAATALLRFEAPAEELRALAGWSVARGPIFPLLPRPLRWLAEGAADPDGALLALRTARARACDRTFIGAPFHLSQAVALVLLREAEVRAATALVLAHGDEAAAAAALRALAGSAMRP